ncbi:MAG: hypothetical protein E7200_04860 [Selenomonas ruminantium]|nr:hypothetical protein [Selenomonas ruminantium]
MSSQKFYHYDIAYKTADMDKFQVVKPPHYGWIADPFLVEYEGTIYLFAEVFLYKTERNGKIGYCKYENGGFSDWTITMDRHWHLSYPNVFVKDGKLYMCPESYQSSEVSTYELVAFPNQWKKVNTYINDVEYCDSTFLQDGDASYMFTFERKRNGTDGNGILCRIADGKIDDVRVISSNPAGSRPAGNILKKCGKYIRVAQNSVPVYGTGLIFYEIDSLWPEYHEHEVRRVFVEDISPEWKNLYCGIHTYNRLGDMTVIDLKKETFSQEEYEAQQRVRQIFIDKYR